ncbi:MAG TPA: GNAT family N-acetyltransferase [Pseudogracilibacillus sp.]|nr:GNAT family N-acetyltransferase [Pseudogracilibacillus sp.]
MEIVKGKNKFYIGEDEAKPIAEITYQEKDANTIIVDHTYVSDELRGQGIAGKLVDKITTFAREEKVKIIPTCPYVASKMEKTEAYHDLIAQ